VAVPAAVLALIGGSALAAGATQAQASVIKPGGWIDVAKPVVGGRMMVAGWTLDWNDPGKSIYVDIYVSGVMKARVLADLPRPDVDAARHIHGGHGFSITMPRPANANLVQAWGLSAAYGVSSGALKGTRYLFGAPKPAPRPAPAVAGTRIVAEAKRYLGVPYVTDGATPSGFDCSGYIMWVYSHAGVANLTHNAEAQRHQVRIIPQSQARPGDLIFYLSGNYAYHDAIYAGNGKQYAAPAPGQDVKIETIWSSDIQFGTDWH
jgi:hypothetical protein